MINRTFRS